MQNRHFTYIFCVPFLRYGAFIPNLPHLYIFICFLICYNLKTLIEWKLKCSAMITKMIDNKSELCCPLLPMLITTYDLCNR